KQPTDPRKAAPSDPLPDLSAPSLDPITLPTLKDADGQRLVESSKALEKMANLDKDLRKKLFNGLADKGQGGPGQGGGGGSGAGPGKGAGTGAGSKLSERQKRQLRWVMVFNTFDGKDYVRQLALLGAKVAVPVGDGKHRLYRNLNEVPPKGEIEDVGTLQNIS